jgi:DNA-binding IclR family transcriptional regulator
LKPATTISKVCRVLGEFRNRASLGVSELARRTDLLPSDVHRILNSLQSFGYIEQDPDTRTYHPGLALLKLGLTTVQRTDLREAGQPLLKRLGEELSASTHMAMFDTRELEVFIVEQVTSPLEMAIKPRLGSTEASHCTALGKTILAWMSPETRFLALQKSALQKRTAHTITDLNLLEREFQTIRVQGYGLDREEFLLGTCCIAAPVLDQTGTAVAAISVSMASTRFYSWPEAVLASMTKSAAAELSAVITHNRTTSITRRAGRTSRTQ